MAVPVESLLGLAADYAGDSEGTFGARDEVHPIRHLIGAAVGWGANPPSAALYQSFYPKRGNVPYVLNVKDVPVDGFWSITIYNAEGYMVANDAKAYSVNNVTAKPNPDGSVTIHFGGDTKAANYLPVPDGWNYSVRMYQPRKEILDGTWTFPTPQQAR